ncbi:MAG: Holliday junction branch migration protein RuvA [Clostridia bacterium]|nr:Holliday junction branch migration protein RuvA [Clostridia bacterium]
MIGYLQGKVLHHSNGTVLLETGGVGYEVTCSASAYEVLAMQGKGAIYTYLNVREDGFYLYGFISPEEKSMFLKLISVSGVGPKMGIAILSSMPLNDLAFIIASSDSKTLSKVKGVGKKTAERIILELRENISAIDLPDEPKSTKKSASASNPETDDAVIALLSLGFSRSESEKAVQFAKEQGADTIESIITIALQTIK